MSDSQKFIFEARLNFPRVYEPTNFYTGPVRNKSDGKYSVGLDIEQVPVDLLKKCHRITHAHDGVVYLTPKASIPPMIIPKGGLENMLKLQIVLADADQCRVSYDRLLTHTTGRLAVTLVELDTQFYRGPSPILTAVEVDFEQMAKRLDLILAEVMREDTDEAP